MSLFDSEWFQDLKNIEYRLYHGIELLTVNACREIMERCRPGPHRGSKTNMTSIPCISVNAEVLESITYMSFKGVNVAATFGNAWMSSI